MSDVREARTRRAARRDASTRSDRAAARTGKASEGSRRATEPQVTPPKRHGVAGAIDPRIRARRAEVLRGQARRRLRLVITVVAVLVVAAGCWGLLHSSVFSARVVKVVGAVHTPASAVVAAAGLSDHPPLIDVGAASTAGVERLPWIERATVTTEWPDGVRITVVERTPVAAVSDGSGWALVARSGKVLARTRAPSASLVRVTGTMRPGAPGTTLRGAGPVLAVAGSLPKAFESQVASVQADAGGDVTLHLTSALTVNLGSTADLAKKYEDVAAILSGAQLTSGEVIDVQAPAAPVVTP